MERELVVPGTGTLPNEWLGAVNNFAIMFPDLAEFWLPWWAQMTPGQSIGVLQYCSALMYGAADNPVFLPWTRSRGYGPPNVWGAVGHFYAQCWRSENVSFIAETLTPEYVTAAVQQAAERLQPELDHPAPAKMVDDLSIRRETLARRLKILPEILAAPQNRYFDWADAGV